MIQATSKAAHTAGSGVGTFDMTYLRLVNARISGGELPVEGENCSPDSFSVVAASLREAVNDPATTKQLLVLHLAEYSAAILASSPFGATTLRVVQWAVKDATGRAGYVFAKDRQHSNEWRWLNAIRTTTGNIEIIKGILATQVRTKRSVAFEQLPRLQALAAHPELAHNYSKLDLLKKQMIAHLDRGDKQELTRDRAVKQPLRQIGLTWQTAQQYAEDAITTPQHRQAFLDQFRSLLVDRQQQRKILSQQSFAPAKMNVKIEASADAPAFEPQ